MKVSAQPKNKAMLGQLSDMDLRLLRVFKSVVDCGGMAAAELDLNIGVSTISRHVKDLELRLGLTLCRRGRAGFSLTPEGERVHAETVRLLAATDAFRHGMDDIHQRMGGELNLAVFDKTATNPEARIGAAIAAFTQQAPQVKLVLHVAPINTIERQVIAGEFQVGIIPAHRSSEALDYNPLFNEAMRLYCGREHSLFVATEKIAERQHAQRPAGRLAAQKGAAKAASRPVALDWADLRQHRFAGLGYHSPNMELSHEMRLPRAATGFDQESIATLILSGQFLGFLPQHYARVFEAEGLMRAVQPDRFRYDASFVAITRRAPKPSRAALLLRDCLVTAHGRAGSGLAVAPAL